MSYFIRCYTLFDITQTGNRQRSCPVDQDSKSWSTSRNQQCNFDTVMQSISMRSLPEIISSPRLEQINKHKFGSKYKKKIKHWQFDFSVNDINVWKEDADYLYHLHKDCDGVPMIICGTENLEIGRALSTNDDDRNIYFEVIGNEETNR